MNKHKKLTLSEPEADFLRDEYLDADELFLIGFLQGFNRKNEKEWTEKSIWVFDDSSY